MKEKKLGLERISKLAFDKACEASDVLNDITGKWTIDYASAAFVIYFMDKKWLIEDIVDMLIEEGILKFERGVYRCEEAE
jgi:hypothetical protein